MVEFIFLKDMEQKESKIMLNFRKAKFQLSVNKNPSETILNNKGEEESWQIFNEAFLNTQELSILRCRSQERMVVKQESKKKRHR